MTESLFYKCNELAKMLNYKRTLSFELAIKKAPEGSLLKEIDTCRLPQKLGKSHVFPKLKIDPILKREGLINA